jgi:two-component system nitrogen regulation sensor histidine kinase NtrY
MNFQARLTLALLAIAAVPLAILGYGVRRELTARIDAEAARQVAGVRSQVTARVASIAAGDRGRLESLAADLATDNRFRVATQTESPLMRVWLVDWAAATLRLTGLAVLRVQDATGKTVSVGEAHDDVGRELQATAAAIASSPGAAAVIDARSARGPVRALVSMATFTVGADTFRIVGGSAFDSARVAQLSPDNTIEARLRAANAPTSEGAIAVATLPLVDEFAAQTDTVQLLLIPDLGPTRQLRAEITRWLLITLSGTLVVAILVASLMGRLVSAPIEELVERTERLDLDKLEMKFATGRDDELGVLERTLDSLTGRLRTSVSRLREAERAAATGDLARQINHDIKNGLTPIRNVLRHLSQIAEKEPASLGAIYAERKGTLESSVEYLDQLARTYAKLSPALGRALTDPRPILREVAASVSAATMDLRVSDTLPSVRADAVVLRRIVENLVSNATEALEGKPGTISLGAAATNGRVRITVSDTGRGMTKQELDRAFDDFFTTKESGTGLGLSVVRRLVTDLGGSVRAETAPGQGSTFTVEIPSADAP